MFVQRPICCSWKHRLGLGSRIQITQRTLKSLEMKLPHRIPLLSWSTGLRNSPSSDPTSFTSPERVTPVSVINPVLRFGLMSYKIKTILNFELILIDDLLYDFKFCLDSVLLAEFKLYFSIYSQKFDVFDLNPSVYI